MAYVKDNPNTLTAGEWLADALEPDMMIPGGGILDIAQFPAQDAVTVVVTGTAAQNATSISITALVNPLPAPIATYTVPTPVLIPSGTVLYFGGQKIATLTADALVGATTLTVAALPTALAALDTATYAGAGRLFKAVVSGTIVGRTLAERDARTAYGPAVYTDDEIFIVAFDKSDLSKDASVDLVRPYDVAIYENMLPQYTALNTAANEVQTVTINGTLSAGTIILGDGKGKTVSIAYNANLSAIQTGLDTLFGATNTVAAGTVASFTVTFAVALAGALQTLMTVSGATATGFTNATVVRTTPGGRPLLERLRQLFRCGVAYN